MCYEGPDTNPLMKHAADQTYIRNETSEYTFICTHLKVQENMQIV
jgi:hypothetical protein